MDVLEYLKGVSQRLGPSGHEREVSQWLAKRFEPLCDSVEIDPVFNVIALKKGTGTKDGKRIKVLLCAHQDEIALMVSDILPDGTLRLGQVGGVDPRILPASTVTVHGKRDLLGVVGAKSPHLLTAEERKQNYKREDLFVDVGMAYEKVYELVHVGDLVTLRGDVVELQNGRVAGRCMDDRACVGVMLQAAELLQGVSHVADLYFVATVQEEVGSRGAAVAAYRVDPDVGIALDVCHATLPGSRPDTTVPLDAPAATFGPFIQPKLLDRLMDTAKANHVSVTLEAAERFTYTDCDSMNIAREGVPCVLLSLPLKYMHTSVELIDTQALTECARLIAAFAQGLKEGWDEALWN